MRRVKENNNAKDEWRWNLRGVIKFEAEVFCGLGDTF